MPLDPLAPDVGLDAAKGVVGLDPLVDPNAPPPPGPFKRGLKSGVADLKSIGGGLVEATGAGLGVKAAQDYGAGIVKSAAEESAPYRMQVEDVVSGKNSPLDLIKYAVGNQLPMLATTVLGGVAGRGVGALLSRGAVAAAKSETEALVAAATAKDLGAELGLGAASVGMEAGQIAPEALDSGVEHPLARTAAGALAAGALDTILPVVLARRMGLIRAATKKLLPREPGMGAFVKEALMTAAGAGTFETATEGAQTAIERLAAGQPLTGAEASSDYVNSAVMGGIMGVLTGGVAGGVRAAQRPVQNPPPFTGREQPPEVNAPPIAPTPAPTDLADLATLLAQQQDVIQRQAALDAEKPASEGGTRTKSEIVTESRALKTQSADLATEIAARQAHAADTQIGAVPTQIGAPVERAPRGRVIKDETGAEVTVPHESGAFKQPAPADTRAAETGVAQTKREKGLLVSGREAKLLRDADAAAPGKLALEIKTEGTPRERIKDVAPEHRAEVITGVATQSIERNVAELTKAGGFRKGTQVAAQNALVKAVEAAAQAPTVEAAAEQVHAAAIHALAGKVNKADAEQFAQLVAKDVRSAPTFYSKAAVGLIGTSPKSVVARLQAGERLRTGYSNNQSALFVDSNNEQVPHATMNRLRKEGRIQIDRDGFVGLVDGVISRQVPQVQKSKAALAPTKISDLLAYVPSIARTHLAAGGSSTNLVTGQDLGGTNNYAVSIYKDRELRIPGQPSEQQIAQYIEQNSDLLANPDNMLGTWFKEKDQHTHIDVSVLVPTVGEAMRLGRENQQEAIFYLGTYDEIPVGSAEVFDLSQEYNSRAGLQPAVAVDYLLVDEARMTQIAQAYERMLPNNAADPAVAAAYRALTTEVEAQFAFASQRVQVEPWRQPGQPYANSAAMMGDVKTGHLYVFEGGEPHPLMTPEQNWKFRAIHDIFGHAKTGFEFGPRGELNATRSHAQMFSTAAWPALMTETLGQNAWVNYSEVNKGKAPSERAYAVQKADLLPEGLWHDLLDSPRDAREQSIDQHDRIFTDKGQRLIGHLKFMVGDDPGLTVRTFTAEAGGAVGSYTRTGPFKSIVSLAVNAKNELSVADHEGFHYLEDHVLDGRERLILGRQLAPSRPLFEKLIASAQRYDLENKTNLVDEIRSVPQEARAYGYEFWRRGELTAEGTLGKIFEKIQQFLERVRNFIDGLGFQSIEDIFQAIDRGQYAERTKHEGGIGSFASVAGKQEWYRSALNDQVDALPTKAASAQGWKDQIKGLVAKGLVKQAEIDAVGLNDYLDLQQGKVTKDQVTAFLRENGVRVEETLLGGAAGDKSGWTQEASARLDELENRPNGQLTDAEEGERQALISIENAATPDSGPINITKFATYQLPGGKNYRELVLSLPDQGKSALGKFQDKMAAKYGDQYRFDFERFTPEEQAAYWIAAEQPSGVGDLGPQFRSSHFDQPNILAHIRFNERTDAEGKRVLFIEEIQSDYAQAWRKAFDASRAGKPFTTIPSVPFVTKTEAWVGLSLKRMIRYAAENGFDKVAWANGTQQAARYDLSKQVNKIEWAPVIGKNAQKIYIDFHDGAQLELDSEDGKGVHVLNPTRAGALASGLEGKPLAEIVGKDIAEKITGSYKGTLTGEGLKVGGEGMKAFYDKIVPNVANDVLKKLGGGRVGEVSFIPRVVFTVSKNLAAGWNILDETGAIRNVFHSRTAADIEAANLNKDIISNKQPGFTITPEMTTRAEAGLPLFSRATIELNRRFNHGELTTEQAKLNVLLLLDQAKAADFSFKQGFGALSEGMAGGVARWYMNNLATQNFVSKYSTGFKNVYRAMTAYTDYKEALISKGVTVGLSRWRAASQVDISRAFDALLQRTLAGHLVGSPEYNSLLADLENDNQREMFKQASGVFADFLNMELAADEKTMRELMMKPDFDKWLTDRTEKVKEMIANGYVPLRRHGDFTVSLYQDVKLEGGTTKRVNISHEQFEHEAGAIFMEQQYLKAVKEAGLDVGVVRGNRHASSSDSDISVQQFLDTARRHGVAITPAERERLAKALTSADSMRRNRLMHREGTAGYSRDGMRVLSEFVTTYSNKIAYSEFGTAINDAAVGFPVDARVEKGVPIVSIDRSRNLWEEDGPNSGYYQTHADQLIELALTPTRTGKWSKNLRGFTMSYMIGGSIATAASNGMSVPMITIPALSQHTSFTNAFSTTLAAWKNVWADQGSLRDVVKLAANDASLPQWLRDDAELRQAMVDAAPHLFDTEIHQIMGMSQGQLFSQSRGVQKAMKLWMAPFQIVEQTNRITSFVAAYKIGRGNNLSGRNLFDFATRMVDGTQNRYDEINRPFAAHNPVWAIMFMFKSFPLFMAEAMHLMYKANPKAAVYMLLGIVAMSGVQGLPFAEDLEDLVDTIAQRIFGSPFNSRRAMRNLLKDASEAIVGADMSEVVLRGVVNSMTGLNIASRVGMGDMLPGTRIGAADGDYGRTVEQLLGAPIAMISDLAKGVATLASGVFGQKDFVDSVTSALKTSGPVALRNVVKGAEQFSTGHAADTKGRKLIDVSSPEAFFQVFGFASAGLNSAYEMDRIDKQTLAFYVQTRTAFMDQLASNLKAGDTVAAGETLAAVQAWNQQFPGLPIGLSAGTIRRHIVDAGMPLNARTLRLLPRQLRGTSLAAEGVIGNQ